MILLCLVRKLKAHDALGISDSLCDPDANQMMSTTDYISNENAPVISPASSIESSHPAPSVELEKECIKLYFANLHLIYFILDKETFMARCESEIWSSNPRVSRPSQKSSRFPALYNAVVAVGVITAGDDTLLAQNLGRVQSFLDDPSTLKQTSGRKIYPPLELAQRYFAKARILLGDFLEVCSLESTQTLFLMVHHSSYWTLIYAKLCLVYILPVCFEAPRMLYVQWNVSKDCFSNW